MVRIYYLCYVENSTLISKRNIVTGAKTTIQTFSSLGETAAVIFDPQENRMYFHHEGSSQFGGGSETLGYVAVTSTQTVPLCASARVPVTVTVNASTLTPSINIVSNFSGNICSNASVTFTASATNGGVTPTYQWRRNGVNVATGVTYTLVSPVNNDNISCVLTSSTFCVTTPTATSNTIVLSVITPSPTPFVSISSSTSGNVCAGTNILFTAAVSNAGSTPVYQWKKNGLNVGTNSATYIDNATISGSITCLVTTNTPCSTTLTSGSIFISPIAPLQPSITIANTTNNTICAGTPVTFTATAVNGGNTPLYQWRKNGVNVATGITYTTSTLLNNDTITCVLTSNYFCVTQNNVVSNAIGITVNVAPSISPVANQIVCPGSALPPVVFSGTGAQFRWTNNNTAIGLAANGAGNLPAFIANNTGTTAISATITATPVSAGSGFAYIANSTNNTVSVINVSTNTIAATIPVGSAPWGVAASPDGSRVYVANSGTPGSVSVINTATNQVIATIATGFTAYDLCVSPDGSKLYVASYNTGNGIYVYNTATNTYFNNYYVGTNIYGITTSPDGSKLYANSANFLYVISTTGASSTVGIPIGTNPIGVIASADGTKVYVANANSNTVSIINVATNTVIASVVTGSSPYNLALSPDGKNLYVTNNTSNNVSVINTATNLVTATIAVGNAPSGISLSADGTMLYVTNQSSNTVSVINTLTNTVTSTLSGFSGPVSWGNFISSRQGCAGAPITFTITVAAPDVNTWIGEVSTDWHTAGNWLCNRIPTANDRVTISVSSKNYYPLILENDTITVKSIRLEPGTKMNVSANASVILTNNQ
jgi:YVTN family beta-propeller protein